LEDGEPRSLNQRYFATLRRMRTSNSMASPVFGLAGHGRVGGEQVVGMHERAEHIVRIGELAIW